MYRRENMRSEGGKTKPFKNKERVRMIVISERTSSQRGDFLNAALAADYDEHILFALRDHFKLYAASNAGHGHADHYGAYLSERAAADVDGQQAMLARVDELLAAPVYVDESKVDARSVLFLAD